jgi:lipopolysaccharide heptosyltransferase III
MQSVSEKNSMVKRLLIYRLGSLGDTVVALPALRIIERAFPGAERRLLTNDPVDAKGPPAAAVLEGTGLVEGYLSYPLATRSISTLWRLRQQVRSFRPDLLICLTPLRGEKSARRDAAFFRLCGVRRIMGLGTGDLGRNHYDPNTHMWEREAARLVRCVQRLGSADLEDLRNWDLNLSAAEEEKALAVLGEARDRPLIACGPGTKWQSKEWGEDNWRALLEKLSPEFPEHGLVLVGAKEEREAAERVAKGWKNRTALNFCGKLTPRESAAVLRRAELFLGTDSGPMHMAAAYGVPCAIAFSALDLEGRWFPVGDIHRPIYHKVDCANCRLAVCIEQKKKCLTSISVEEMMAAALEAWREGQAEREIQSSSGGARACTL